MKIIVTNDDGVQAPGLEHLRQIAAAHGTPLIVAPEVAQSGVGHRVTTHRPIRVARLEPDRYSVGGTPVDCVRIALKALAPDADWLLAGINPGANLGSDVYQSGTVAAAREAAIFGVRAMAVSQYIGRDRQLDWKMTGRNAAVLVALLLQKKLAAGTYWNVNLPHADASDTDLQYRFCPLDTNPHKYELVQEGDQFVYRGTIHERPRTPDHDVAVCFGGEASITRLAITG